ncbi:hypothetical protein [Pseudonocardia pini]|uniref:hypothetical protein n=1 Tax=Pseudonocardia pini TaxID=2758030 RepID=UPI0015F1161D|nr:hypothetical protein [Pseudonocardia pini]
MSLRTVIDPLAPQGVVIAVLYVSTVAAGGRPRQGGVVIVVWAPAAAFAAVLRAETVIMGLAGESTDGDRPLGTTGPPTSRFCVPGQ